MATVLEQRDKDLALLKTLLDQPLAMEGEKWSDDEIRPNEYDAFSDMLEGLQEDWPKLTDKQRDWATAVAERIGCAPPISADDVPRGKEVPTPSVLQNLPKSPPRRH